MRKQFKSLLLLLFALLLGACASGPRFPTEGVDLTLTPQQASAETTPEHGKEILWGGMIINSVNLERQTRLEVLGYPLDSSQYPQTDSRPLGRFLVIKAGYLETVDFAPGRLVTVRGKLDGIQNGKVGETRYTYPLVYGQNLYLWPRGGKSEPRVHFGVGVVFGH